MEKKPQVGESAVIVGKCLHFLCAETSFSDSFIWYLGQGALVHPGLHMCCKMRCVNQGASLAASRYFTQYVLVSSSEPVWAPAAGAGHS